MKYRLILTTTSGSTDGLITDNGRFAAKLIHTLCEKVTTSVIRLDVVREGEEFPPVIAENVRVVA